ncbi:MAG: DoxX family protein [Gammaproteobacteria bacterium]
MNTTMQNAILLLARILFSGIFIFSGFGKLMDFQPALDYMVSAGLTWHPAFVQVVAIIFELGGGLLVLFGWHTRVGATALFIFTLLTCFLIHHFWSYPMEVAQMQMIQFMKNITIMGGALYIIVFGPGDYSMDKK